MLVDGLFQDVLMIYRIHVGLPACFVSNISHGRRPLPQHALAEQDRRKLQLTRWERVWIDWELVFGNILVGDRIDN